MYLQCSHGFWGQYFSGWCFTHQYKYSVQFRIYATSILSQNTKTSKTGHTHDDRYYTEKEIDAKLKKNLLIPSRYATSGTITTYQFTPQVCDQGILVICRSELYIIKLGQSNNVFNMCECIQVSNHTSVMNATASLGDDKKTVILKCKLYENPVLIGRFSA